MFSYRFKASIANTQNLSSHYLQPYDEVRMAYIFLDESGHFGKQNHEKYFVVGSFTVGEPRRTAKGFRKWCRTHFHKKMRTQSEIKWSATHIDDQLRLRTLKYISKLDVRIRYTYLLKRNIPAEYRDRDKFKDGLLYTNIIETVDSVSNVNIQIADWISGALARYLEKGRLGNEFYAILKENLISDGKELFNSILIV